MTRAINSISGCTGVTGDAVVSSGSHTSWTPTRCSRFIADLMPALGLIYHEWDQYGTCSGLEAQAYFDLIRKARETVKIPESYAAPKTTLTVAPDEVEEAFVKSNPGLSRAAIFRRVRSSPPYPCAARVSRAR